MEEPLIPEQDPGLPELLLHCLDNLDARETESGVLIIGLAGPPVFLTQVAAAARFRFPDLSEEGVEIVKRAAARALAETRRQNAAFLRRGGTFANSWEGKDATRWAPPR